MRKSLNQVFLIGHVGRDPDIRHTQGAKGTLVANFSLATNRRPREDRSEPTDWHRCTAWGKLAEIVEKHVKVGDQLHIHGELQYDSYERDDGMRILTAEIVVRDIVMLGSSRKEGST